MKFSSLGPVYTKRQRQRCDDACDSVLIENNGVTPEWVCNPFSSDSTVFNKNRIASIITALTLTLGVNRPLRRHEIYIWSQLRRAEFFCVKIVDINVEKFSYNEHLLTISFLWFF